MASPNPYIRKKAALCAMRIVRKVDEIEDKFNNKIGNLLEDSWGMKYHITYNKCSFFGRKCLFSPA